jgi:hypothetical protein
MRCRPSILVGISDPLVAFYTDRAIWTFATAIQEEMEAALNRLPTSAKDKARQRAQQRVLDTFLGVEEVEQPQRFRSPGMR